MLLFTSKVQALGKTHEARGEDDYRELSKELRIELEHVGCEVTRSQECKIFERVEVRALEAKALRVWCANRRGYSQFVGLEE